MGSSISSLVVELVLHEQEKVAFHHYEPAFWRRYVNDTFVIIERSRLADFQDLLNGIFPDIQFTREEEHAEQLPFIDVLVARTPNGEPSTTVHRKATNTTQILNYHSIACPYRDLLLQLPNIIKPQFRSGEIQHDVVHHIRPSGPPVFARPRRLALPRLQAAKAEFEHMLQLGIIRPSESTWASPLHMVPKASSDDWRPCGDYRALNNATIPDRYPELELFSENRFIDRVLRDLPFVYAYINDLLLASRNAEEHKEHLALVFHRLDQFGVVLNPSKCVLGVPSLDFLGHRVDAQGLRPLSSEVEAIRDFPPPTSKRQLQRFLGMVNFYRRFLPNCADLMLPLTNLLSGPKGPLELRGHALTAFERIKTSLADATLLTHPAPETPSSLMVDASTVAVGAVLQQQINDLTRPLALFSKKLSPAKTRYSTFGREFLAIYLAVKHFRHFLEGRDFTILTAHKPLTFAIRSDSDKYNPREISH
nr:unnamed protein product [Spirometra erinaceieuropaei]